MSSENTLTERQKQAIETKKKIYDTAMRLLSELGFEKLTISKICKEAGVAVGSFYYYFKSLDFVVIESYKIVDENFKRIREENLLTGNVSDKIKQLVHYQTAHVHEMGIEIVSQVYKSQMNIGNEYFGSWHRELPMLYVDTIKEGQKNGEIRDDVAPEAISRELVILVRGYIYDWCVHKGNYDLTESAQDSIRKYMSFYMK